MDHWRHWLRPPEVWEPPYEDATGQFRSLTRHLFAIYDVPRFLDPAWLAGLTPESLRYQGWYKHVGRGENIRTATDLPIPLTRTMSYWFAQAPDDLDIPSAFRWAQVRGMSGDDRLARTILDGRVGTDLDRDDFWIAVIRPRSVTASHLIDDGPEGRAGMAEPERRWWRFRRC